MHHLVNIRSRDCVINIARSVGKLSKCATFPREDALSRERYVGYLLSGKIRPVIT